MHSGTGNDNFSPPCSDYYAATEECDIHPPQRWLGYSSYPWARDRPPQFSVTSLPYAAMIAAKGGDFAVDLHTTYSVKNCTAATQLLIDSKALPDPTLTNCANDGGGGQFLSNESAYRNTTLRDILQVNIAAGHIHTPIPSVGNNGIFDATLENSRVKIYEQTKNLIFAVAKALPATTSAP
jgi:hypothetical protein